MYLLVFLSIFGVSQCYIVSNTRNTLIPLSLFNFGQKKDATVAPKAAKMNDEKQLALLKQGLEKVSNQQKRDWVAEAAKNKPKEVEIKDKQITSYNFGKSNEFPNLYSGWIKKEGDQIAKQAITAAKNAISKGEKYIEILFDPVPNLDEVAFGTEWNKKFRLEAAANLQVPDYACNRGGPATLEWSNLYWANRLAGGLGKKGIVALSISGEGLRGQFKPVLDKSLTLINLSDAKRGLITGEVNALILLSPCQQSHYADGKALADKYNVPIIALNSPYSYIYDVGGGAPWTLAYVMKRIPKGWIFRRFPDKFEAIIEGPNYEVFRAAQFPTQPSLVQISKVSMEASQAKYGATGNDRIFQNRL